MSRTMDLTATQTPTLLWPLQFTRTLSAVHMTRLDATEDPTKDRSRAAVLAGLENL